MTWTLRRVMICITCWRKLHGPAREPVRYVGELRPGERWTPCHLCAGPCDAMPGIHVRMYDCPDVRRVDCTKRPA